MSPVSYVSNWALQWPDLKLTQAAPVWLRSVHLPRPQALVLTLLEVTERSPGRGGTCLAKKTCVGECERTCQTPGRQSPSSGDSRSPWGWGGGCLGAQAGEERLTQQLWREKRPFPGKFSLFISTVMRNVHIPAKPAGHTLAKSLPHWRRRVLGRGQGSCPVRQQSDFLAQ